MIVVIASHNNKHHSAIQLKRDTLTSKSVHSSMKCSSIIYNSSERHLWGDRWRSDKSYQISERAVTDVGTTEKVQLFNHDRFAIVNVYAHIRIVHRRLWWWVTGRNTMSNITKKVKKINNKKTPRWALCSQRDEVGNQRRMIRKKPIFQSFLF